jgi:hypothetical protein
VDPASKPYILISREASLDPHDAATIHLEEGELHEVTNHIQQLTEDLAGQHDIEDEPIHIKYVRPEGLAFTIIDLPGTCPPRSPCLNQIGNRALRKSSPFSAISGITHKLAYEEAREVKVYEKTCALVRKYVQQEDMLILCVIPANTDFGNAAALSIAEEVDPKGLRTLGVITKVHACPCICRPSRRCFRRPTILLTLSLRLSPRGQIDMVPDKYSDVVDHILMRSSKSIKLELGYYAVRNRTPEELDRGGQSVLKWQSDLLPADFFSLDCVQWACMKSRRPRRPSSRPTHCCARSLTTVRVWRPWQRASCSCRSRPCATSSR